MGKGDKKSKRGKIILGSFGVRRRKKARKSIAVPSPKEAAKAAVTAAAAASPEVQAAKPAKTARPKTAAKPAAKSTKKVAEAKA